MPTPNDDSLSRLVDASLPAASGVRDACLELLGEERSALSDIVPLASQDPGLTLTLLGHVNQKRRRSAHGITTVESAVSLMGKGGIEDLLRSLPTIEELTQDAAQRAAFTQLRWRAFHAGLQARDWAAQRQDRSPLEAATMAQLVSVGDMLLCAHDYPRYREITGIVLSQPCSDRCAEQRTLGRSLLALGRDHVTRQGLDETTLEAFDPMSVFNPRMVAVQLACELARQAERSWYSDSMAHCLSVAADFLHKTETRVDSEVHATAIEAARVWRGDGRPSTANLLWPTEIALGPETTPAPPRPTSAQPAESTARSPARSIVAGTTPAEVLQALVQALKDMAGLHRGLFFLLGRDRETLTPRFASGLGADAPVMQRPVRLTDARLFKQLLGKPVAVWINADNYEKLGIGLPRALIEALQSRNLFLMSVFVGTQPIGIVVTDADGEALDGRDYATFKQMTLLTSKRLTQLRQANSGASEATQQANKKGA